MNTTNLCPIPTPDVGRPEISMAPLVDIVFLLLIFFMVTTIFPDNDGLLIEKPSSKNAAALSDDSLVITLDKQARVYIDGALVDTADVTRLIKAELITMPQLLVRVNADRRATTEALINVIDAAKAGGAQRLGIATNDY